MAVVEIMTPRYLGMKFNTQVSGGVPLVISHWLFVLP